MGADYAQQFPQGQDIGRICRAIGLDARCAHVRRAPQGNHMAGIDRDEQHSQDTRLLRLRLAMQVERFAQRRCRLAWLTAKAPRHRLQ